jgi:hypothetical protein
MRETEAATRSSTFQPTIGKLFSSLPNTMMPIFLTVNVSPMMETSPMVFDPVDAVASAGAGFCGFAAVSWAMNRAGGL